jgi:ATP-dependent DNA helicase RecG
MEIPTPRHSEPRLDDEVVDRLLAVREGQTFETKRVGDNRRKIETIVAMANTEGGVLLLGVDDEDRSRGRDRVFGIEENAESVDELERLIRHRVTPLIEPPLSVAPRFLPIGGTLRDGTRGSVIAVIIPKSTAVHSVVDGGTYVRLAKSNRMISAAEITELSMRRGAVSVVSGLVDVPFDLLDTSYWRAYAAQRRLTRQIAEALRHLGLAREEGGALRPTRAAVLLFAEEPSGLLDSKCAIRLFHYKGDAVERTAATNLLRPPRTIGGPLLAQIRDATAAVLNELATGVQVGPLGFEIAQRYPVRVVTEAITNAVIHRDYRISADIHIRLFADRVEVESPGALPGGVTASTIGSAGSHPRNRAIVDHLREFSNPPNLDAGEGVPMMRQTMAAADLYPPVFLTGGESLRDAVIVQLSNQARPSIWDQVEAHLDKKGSIGNAEVRALLHTDDPVRASKLLKSWVERGLLAVVDPTAAKQQRRYQRPGSSAVDSLFSLGLGKPQ